ncbi:MAG TPA: nickel pincer cofactor biosynthesis protein LarB [Planctomycetes bacterium]|nr:nickel pincer cofactor biosynthesis protein LarB [Planctomycetota bacterium]
MDRLHLRELLDGVRTGSVDVEEGLRRLASMPFEDVDVARIDTHRDLRCGFGEVVFGQGKTQDEVVRISRAILERDERLLVTRIDADCAKALATAFPRGEHHERARCFTVGLPPHGGGKGDVLILTAGTSDAPVAEEAEITARMMGARTELLRDMGVAGVHRALAEVERLRAATALVVVAGMEGALASLVGGLVSAPVIAVPTSVGYGSSFGGLAALLAMLNSCAAGVTVVNIDNGFGAGAAAARMNRVRTESSDPFPCTTP